MNTKDSGNLPRWRTFRLALHVHRMSQPRLNLQDTWHLMEHDCNSLRSQLQEIRRATRRLLSPERTNSVRNLFPFASLMTLINRHNPNRRGSYLSPDLNLTSGVQLDRSFCGPEVQCNCSEESRRAAARQLSDLTSIEQERSPRRQYAGCPLLLRKV